MAKKLTTLCNTVHDTIFSFKNHVIYIYFTLAQPRRAVLIVRCNQSNLSTSSLCQFRCPRVLPPALPPAAALQIFSKSYTAFVICVKVSQVHKDICLNSLHTHVQAAGPQLLCVSCTIFYFGSVKKIIVCISILPWDRFYKKS